MYKGGIRSISRDVEHKAREKCLKAQVIWATQLSKAKAQESIIIACLPKKLKTVQPRMNFFYKEGQETML